MPELTPGRIPEPAAAPEQLVPTGPIRMPTSPLYAEADAQYEVIRQTDNAIRAAIHGVTQTIEKEMRAQLTAAHGTEAKLDAWRAKRKQAADEARPLVAKMVADAYAGKFGRGDLRIRYKRDEDKLMRVLPVEGMIVGERDEERREVSEYSVLGPSDDLSGFDDFSKPLRSYLEVDMALTTKEDLDEMLSFFLSRLRSPYILRAFPADYRPTWRPGATFAYGGHDHDAGSIEGKGIVLPSGRIALLSDAKTSRGNEQRILWGVIPDERTFCPSWSAKYELSLNNAAELLPLTDEEKAYLAEHEEAGFTETPEDVERDWA